MKRLKVLNRERVNRALESIFNYPLTVVEAPMGYGKTTAVRNFLSACGCPVLWITFFSTEDTAAFFWDSLTKAICKLDQTAGAGLKSLGFPIDAPQTANILSVFNDMKIMQKIVLVIDDFHYVKDRQIGGFLKQIVKEELNNLYIVVVTRDTTNLDIAEITAKGLCNIISQKQLRFSDNEIREYCTAAGCTLEESELKEISEYTGGWISLIYLILLGMEQGIPMGMSKAIDELVETVLYEAYEEDIRRFLLRLSVMENFTAEQAAFVTREKKAKELLKRLRRENAFISLDETAGVYKIHNVLLDFLRMRQNRELKELHMRTGEWHLKQKEYIIAYGYFCRAGETELLLSLLNEKENITLELAEFEGCFQLFGAAPRELLFKYPIAYLQYICSLIFNRDDAYAKEGAERLNEFQEYIECMEFTDPDLRKSILAEIYVARIFTVFNDAEKMIFYTKKAAGLLEGKRSCLMQRKSEFTFGSPHFFYSYYREPGRLKETIDIMIKGFSSFSGIADGCGTGSEYVTLAEYALETGEWDAVEQTACKAFYKAKSKEQTGLIICAKLTLIRLYLLQGKIAEGLEILRQLRRDVLQENNAFYNTTMDLCDGYVYGCLGQLDQIPEWLQSGCTSPARFMYQGIGFNYIVSGKAVLLSGNYLKLEILIEDFAQYFSVFNNQLGFLHSRIFEAAVKCRLYGIEKGCEALREALDMGRKDNIILPFAENAPVILNMMRRLTGIQDEYAGKVLRSCERYMESLKNYSKSTVSLTAREREVLAYAAEGLKREEIAERLVVSVGTIRTHLQNIYKKLEVNGKTAAIKKAERLQLL